MKAVLFKGKGRLEIEDVAIPKVDKEEVLVEVKATGICGTDRHIYNGEAPAKPPMIPGHEIAGVVVDLGERVSNLKRGDRIAVDPNIFCNNCFYCKRGEIHLCENLEAVGVTRDGGFAQYVLIPAANVYRLPDSISYTAGAMVEPLSCCLHGIDIAEVQTGDLVVVLGGGAIGLILAQLALLSGAREVIISEPDSSKREKAKSLGLENVVVPDMIKEVVTNLSKYGADVVIEAVGRAETVAQSFELVRRGGTIVLFGVSPEDMKLPISPFDIYQKELTVKGSYINPFVTDRAIDILASGKIEVEGLVTKKYSLEDLPDYFSKGKGSQDIKSLLVFE